VRPSGGKGWDEKNPLAADWHAFRRERDDRAWKWLTDTIRAHARSKNRRVLISANGLARYVDLQVLGVWDSWRVKNGAVDLAESQIQEWASTVQAGWALAGRGREDGSAGASPSRRRVPVVYFHDWGFGGFPWMQISPADRRLWMRVRGAEIYAAGGFFAFPVHGPFGNDAARDATLGEVARQTAFYQRNKALFLNAHLVGFEPLASLPRVSDPREGIRAPSRRLPSRGRGSPREETPCLPSRGRRSPREGRPGDQRGSPSITTLAFCLPGT
jgi:hypothetical protein